MDGHLCQGIISIIGADGWGDKEPDGTNVPKVPEEPEVSEEPEVKRGWLSPGSSALLSRLVA